jgi:hypothetical protein
MKTYYETARGDCTERESIEHAKSIVLLDHPEAVFGPIEPDPDGGERILVWGDDGKRVLGQIVRWRASAVSGERKAKGNGESAKTDGADARIYADRAPRRTRTALVPCAGGSD